MENGVTDAPAYKALREAQKKALGVFFPALGSLTGLLAMFAVRGLFDWSMLPAYAIPFLLAAFTCGLITSAWRVRYLYLAAGNLVVSGVLYLLPHASNGGLGAMGILICMLVFGINAVFVQKLFKVETKLALMSEKAGKVSEAMHE